jgi:hypothetical protein
MFGARAKRFFPLPLAGEGRVRARWFNIPHDENCERFTPNSLTRRASHVDLSRKRER